MIRERSRLSPGGGGRGDLEIIPKMQFGNFVTFSIIIPVYTIHTTQHIYIHAIFSLNLKCLLLGQN